MGRLKNGIAFASYLSDGHGDIPVNNNGVVPLIILILLLKNSKKIDS